MVAAAGLLWPTPRHRRRAREGPMCDQPRAPEWDTPLVGVVDDPTGAVSSCGVSRVWSGGPTAGMGISLVTGGLETAAVASRLRKAPISSIVLISGAGNMIVEFLSTPI